MLQEKMVKLTLFTDFQYNNIKPFHTVKHLSKQKYKLYLFLFISYLAWRKKMFFDSLIVRASCAEISVWSFEMLCVATLTVSSADLPACCENWDLKLAEILHRVRDWLKTQVPEFYLSVNVTYSESQMLCFISAYRNQEVGCINIDPERWNRKCQEIGIHVPVIKLWLFSPGLHILVFHSLN